MAKRKVHWTLTAEGKKRWAKIQRKATRALIEARKHKQKEKAHGDSSSNGAALEGGDIRGESVAYLYGRIEALIETQARSDHVSAATLAFRLGQLLLKQARR